MMRGLLHVSLLLVAAAVIGQGRDVFVAPGSSIPDAIQKVGPGGRVILLAGQHVIAQPIHIYFPVTIAANLTATPGSVQVRGGNGNSPMFISNGVDGISITGLYFVPVSGVAGADHRGAGPFVWHAIKGSDLVFRRNRVYNFRSGLECVNCNRVVNLDNVISGGQ